MGRFRPLGQRQRRHCSEKEEGRNGSVNPFATQRRRAFRNKKNRKKGVFLLLLRVTPGPFKSVSRKKAVRTPKKLALETRRWFLKIFAVLAINSGICSRSGKTKKGFTLVLEVVLSTQQIKTPPPPKNWLSKQDWQQIEG